MQFDEQRDLALAELKDSGIWRSNHTPPYLLLAWKLGLRSRPPHYHSFAVNFLGNAFWFGIVWGLLMWLFIWREQGMPWWVQGLGILLAGALFGLFMATYYKWSAARHGLTSWKELGRQVQRRS